MSWDIQITFNLNSNYKIHPYCRERAISERIFNSTFSIFFFLPSDDATIPSLSPHPYSLMNMCGGVVKYHYSIVLPILLTYYLINL